MNKYIASLVVGLFFISNISLTSAASNLTSISFKSLLNQKALKVTLTLKLRYPQNSSLGNLNPLYLQPNQDTTFVLDAAQDIYTPGMIKASQTLTVSGPLLSFSGVASTSTFEDRIIGDTVYIKLPASLLNGWMNIISDNYNSVKTNNIPDTWIQITKNDINTLPSDYSSIINSFYNYLTTFNTQPIQFLKSHQDDWLSFTQAFNLKKSGTRVAEGEKVNVFNLTFDKNAFRKALIKSRSQMYSDGKLPAYELSNIKSEVDGIQIKNGSFALYANNTNLPSSLSGSIYSYNSYDKKLSMITDIDLKFSKYGVPLTPEIPKNFMTATAFFNQYIKPSLDQARVKGQEAAIKANASSLRALAELIYSENNNSYGNTTNLGNCSAPTAGSLFNPTTQSGNQIRSTMSQITTSGATNIKCYSNSSTWAFSVTLPSGTNYCVDSTGQAKTINSPISGNVCF